LGLMTNSSDLFVGVDVGTGGVRVCAVTGQGDRVALAQRGLRQATVAGLPDGWHEQRPADWWAAAQAACGELGEQLGTAGWSAESADIIAAVAKLASTKAPDIQAARTKLYRTWPVSGVYLRNAMRHDNPPAAGICSTPVHLEEMRSCRLPGIGNLRFSICTAESGRCRTRWSR